MPIVVVPRDKPSGWRAYCNERKLPRPLLVLEWAFEWTAYCLSRWTLVELLEYIGRFSVLVAVILYFAEAGERQQSRHFQAWQVINTAQGKGGSGGRIDALRELNDDHVALIGVDVSGAYLQGVQLESADLRRASFASADVRDARLAGANLENADLHFANFRSADLSRSRLVDANLVDADLTDATLAEADLAGATFDRADLRRIDLRGVVAWDKIARITGANIAAVRNAPPGFTAWAIQHGAVERPEPR